MSPKLEATGGVVLGAMEDCSVMDSSSSAAGTERCASSPAPAATVPAMTQAARRPQDDSSSRQSTPPVKRKTCLRISTSPPVDSAAANAHKRTTTPSNIAVTAGSSSVVASKGMLFSRAELRPAPLSASRKYDSNVGFGFHSSSPSDLMSSSYSSSHGWPAAAGDQAAASSTGKKNSPAGPRFNASCSASSTSSSATPAPAVVRPSESFATLRIMEARRRAAWSFEPSPRTSSSSPPPPSLAALGSRSAGSYRRRSPNRGPAGSTMPPLPQMKSFAPTGPAAASASTAAAAAAAPARPPPLPPRRRTNPQLLISAAYGGPAGGRAAAAAAPAQKERVIAAPLSEPSGREKDRTRETLEQKWAAWQMENKKENKGGPAPNLGQPAPAPVVPVSDQTSFGECRGGGGGGGKAGWGGVGDFHDKVAFLGDYVASVFGRAKRGVGAQQRYDGGVQVQYGVE